MSRTDTAPTTDTRSEIEKLYDEAYKQGVNHVVNILKVCADLDRPLSYAIEKVKELLTDKTHTP